MVSANKAVCDERHKKDAKMIAAIVSAFLGIGSLYLYANETYAEKDMVREMKREIREDIRLGFERIEKHIKP